MKTFSVSSLEGAALDWSVATALGFECHIYPDRSGFRVIEDGGLIVNPNYSDDWSQGGPLIEKHVSHLGIDSGGMMWAVSNVDSKMGHECGHTPLIAACRAIVAATFGETIEVPKELI